MEEVNWLRAPSAYSPEPRKWVNFWKGKVDGRQQRKSPRTHNFDLPPFTPSSTSGLTCAHASATSPLAIIRFLAHAFDAVVAENRNIPGPGAKAGAVGVVNEHFSH